MKWNDFSVMTGYKDLPDILDLFSVESKCYIVVTFWNINKTMKNKNNIFKWCSIVSLGTAFSFSRLFFKFNVCQKRRKMFIFPHFSIFFQFCSWNSNILQATVRTAEWQQMDAYTQVLIQRSKHVTLICHNYVPDILSSIYGYLTRQMTNPVTSFQTSGKEIWLVKM